MLGILFWISDIDNSISRRTVWHRLLRNSVVLSLPHVRSHLWQPSDVVFFFCTWICSLLFRWTTLLSKTYPSRTYNFMLLVSICLPSDNVAARMSYLSTPVPHKHSFPERRRRNKTREITKRKPNPTVCTKSLNPPSVRTYCRLLLSFSL